jgi:hypothetical protein
MTRSELNRRRDDIERAARLGFSYLWLANRWNVTAGNARRWTADHATDGELANLARSSRCCRQRLSALAAKRDLEAWRAMAEHAEAQP